MRVAHTLLRGAAAAGLASLAAACIVPPPGVGPRPREAELPAPDVAFYSFDEAPYGAGSGILAYSVTREAYAAAFEVDQRGRVRVVAPSSPRDQMRTLAGKNYILFPQLHAPDREFLSASTDFSRVPFVFVLTSDTPLDLSAFGTGRSWSHEITTGARNPDSAVADVAQRVLADAPAYGSDFAYVGPQLRGGERTFVEACARPLEDVHDYGYYRDLWAVFTPADQRLGINPNWLFSPALGWTSYSLLPLAGYRAQFATEAFYAGCSGSPSAYAAGSLASAGYPGSALYGALGGWGGYGVGYGYVGYGYGGYGYGGYGYGRTGVAVAQANQPGPPLRLPRTPLSFTLPVVAATTGGGGTASAGRVGPGAQQPTAFNWRAVGSQRRPGDVQRVDGAFAAGGVRAPLVARRDPPVAYGEGGWRGRSSSTPPSGSAVSRPSAAPSYSPPHASASASASASAASSGSAPAASSGARSTGGMVVKQR